MASPNLSDEIALWALAVAAAALATSVCAFALEFRRWMGEGVRLAMTVSADSMLIGGGERDPNSYIAINVTNRGNAATTITNMLLFDYPSRWSHKLPGLLRRRMPSQRPKTMIVTNPNPPGAAGLLPFVLEPGRKWHGIVAHTPEIVAMIDRGNLFAGVAGSHSDKPFLLRVRRWQKPKTAKQV